MTQERPQIVEDQHRFFNENAIQEKPDLTAAIFKEYANKEQTSGFVWLGERKRILDYGCGTGTSIDAFLKDNPCGKPIFIGVDIADLAIQKVQQRYPEFTFYAIKKNNIPQVKEGSMDGAYLLHVLHHSHEHDAIFKEIYSKLEPGGKFFLSDLSSNNPIIKLFRSVFVLSPDFIKRRFTDDLVVDGNIPEKYKVDPKDIINKLKETGFSIQEVGYGHLGLFLFAWLDRFIPLSRLGFFRGLFKILSSIEEHLLKYRFFQNFAEVFYIKCIK
jgi:SAM-dependent methyltransferase